MADSRFGPTDGHSLGGEPLRGPPAPKTTVNHRVPVSQSNRLSAGRKRRANSMALALAADVGVGAVNSWRTALVTTCAALAVVGTRIRFARETAVALLLLASVLVAMTNEGRRGYTPVGAPTHITARGPESHTTKSTVRERRSQARDHENR